MKLIVVFLGYCDKMALQVHISSLQVLWFLSSRVCTTNAAEYNGENNVYAKCSVWNHMCRTKVYISM